jgi:hypothetical protein
VLPDTHALREDLHRAQRWLACSRPTDIIKSHHGNIPGHLAAMFRRRSNGTDRYESLTPYTRSDPASVPALAAQDSPLAMVVSFA